MSTRSTHHIRRAPSTTPRTPPSPREPQPRGALVRLSEEVFRPLPRQSCQRYEIRSTDDLLVLPRRPPESHAAAVRALTAAPRVPVSHPLPQKPAKSSSVAMPPAPAPASTAPKPSNRRPSDRSAVHFKAGSESARRRISPSQPNGTRRPSEPAPNPLVCASQAIPRQDAKGGPAASAGGGSRSRPVAVPSSSSIPLQPIASPSHSPPCDESADILAALVHQLEQWEGSASIPAAVHHESTHAAATTSLIPTSLFLREMAEAILQFQLPRLTRLLLVYAQLEANSVKRSSRRPPLLWPGIPPLSWAGGPVGLLQDIDPATGGRLPHPTSAISSRFPSILDLICDQETGFTLLHLAVMSGDRDAVQTCLATPLSTPSDPHRTEDVYGDTPLTLALHCAPSCVCILFNYLAMRSQTTLAGGKQRNKREILRGRESVPRHPSVRDEPPSPPHLRLLEMFRAMVERSQRSASRGPETASPPSSLHRTTLLLGNTLLHSAVTAKPHSPPWPGRLSFIRKLVEEYGFRASAENILGCTAAMWAKENRACLCRAPSAAADVSKRNGNASLWTTQEAKEQFHAIIRYLAAAEKRELADKSPTPPMTRHWLLRETGLAASPSPHQLDTNPCGKRAPCGAKKRSQATDKACQKDKEEAAPAARRRAPSPLPIDPTAALQQLSPENEDSAVLLIATASSTASPTPHPAGHPRVSWARSSLSTSPPPQPVCGHASSVSLALQFATATPSRPLELGLSLSPGRRSLTSLKRRSSSEEEVEEEDDSKEGSTVPMDPLPLLRQSLILTTTDELRWWLQGPVARLALLAFLFLLQLLLHSLEVAVHVEGVWSCELWGTVWNMCFGAWGLSTFSLGCLRVLLMGAFGYGVGYRAFPWLVGQKIGAEWLRLPLFGAQSVEAANFDQQTTEMFFSHFYRGGVARTRVLLRPIGVIGGIYLSAKWYNGCIRWFCPVSYRSWAPIRPQLPPSTFFFLSLSPSEDVTGRNLWLFIWGFSSTLHLFVFICVADLMYQQGALNCRLPHYRYDCFANWVDALWSPHSPYVGTWAHRVMTALTWPLRVRWSRRQSGGSSGSHAEEADRNAWFTVVPLSSVPHRTMRVWCFWAVSAVLWVFLALPWLLAAALVHGGVEGTPSSSAFGSGSAFQAWFCIWISSLAVLCIVCAALQDWNWPSHAAHPLLTYAGGGLPSDYPHPSLLLLLLLLLLATMELRGVVQNSRVWLHQVSDESGRRAAAIFGICLATLPAWIGAGLFILALLSTSLFVVEEMRRRDVGTSLGRFSPPLRVAYEVGKQWCTGVHLFSLPVPPVFGVLRFLQPDLPSWALLKAEAYPWSEDEYRDEIPSDDSEEAEGDMTRRRQEASSKAVLSRLDRNGIYRLAVTDLIERLEHQRLLYRIMSKAKLPPESQEREESEGRPPLRDTKCTTSTCYIPQRVQFNLLHILRKRQYWLQWRRNENRQRMLSHISMGEMPKHQGVNRRGEKST